jgi:hypothetical protein
MGRWTWLLILAAIFVFRTPALASEGVYIEERIASPAMMGEPARAEVVRTWIVGDDLMRQDGRDGRETMLFRLAEKRVVVLDRDANTYVEIPLDRFAPVAALRLTMYTRRDEQGRETVPVPLFKKTGRARRIGKWNCYEVEVQGDPLMGGRPTQWIATNTGLDPRLYARALAIPLGGKLPEDKRPIAEQMVALGGYPVRTVLSRGLGRPLVAKTQTVEVLQRREIDRSIFEVPDGYTKVEIPEPTK